ncbi:hypothetical protein CHLRE_05g247500v5 [Chlamydomonas reinhardtii]|uniref:RING-type E3 ubiquitin transferase n=1 Tax=Chlamydomonas reinhardtii TaxID=3055 RepID=A0A2K3DS21_CHLRE|nr:uncharacterized protein CHLRE_05g247500v5 [Chlamydomonas reinhardtii]PNW83336.1 hypothetical protein CHLRE_05g247500v5 [Chlamydomonas reinhardtii]
MATNAAKRGQETATPASAARPRHRSRADDKENAALQDGAPEDPRLASIKALRDEVTCAVCLDICVRPCTTSCGHNFCRACLRRCLELNQPCPKCRTRLPPGFSLAINTTLYNMIQQLFPAEANAKPLTPPPQQAASAGGPRPAQVPQLHAHRNPAAPFRPPRFAAAAGGGPQPVFTGLSSSRANVGMASAIGRSVSGPRPQRLPITSAAPTGAGMGSEAAAPVSASGSSSQAVPQRGLGGIMGLAELGMRPGTGGAAAAGRGGGLAAAAARRERRRSRSAERWEGGEPLTASVSGPLSFVLVGGADAGAAGPSGSRPVRSSDGRPSASGHAGLTAHAAAAAGAGAAGLPASRSGSGSLLAGAMQVIAEAGGPRGRLHAAAAEPATSLSFNPFMRSLRPIQTGRATGSGSATAATLGATQAGGPSQGAAPVAAGPGAPLASHMTASQRALLQARSHLPRPHHVTGAPSTSRGASGASARSSDSSESGGSSSSGRSSSVFGSGSGEGPLLSVGGGAGGDSCSSGGGGPGAFDDVSMLELEAVPPLPLQGLRGLQISGGPAFARSAGSAAGVAGAPAGRPPAHVGPAQLRTASGHSSGGGAGGAAVAAGAARRPPAVDTAEDQAAAGAPGVGVGGRGIRRSDSDVSGAASRDQGSRLASVPLASVPAHGTAGAAAAATLAAYALDSDSDSVITLDALDVLTPAPAVPDALPGLARMDVDVDVGGEEMALSPSAFATPQPQPRAAPQLRALAGHGAAAPSPSWEELDALMARGLAQSPASPATAMDMTPPALPRLRLPSRAGGAAASAVPVGPPAAAAAEGGMPRLSLPAAALRAPPTVPAATAAAAQPHVHVHHAAAESSVQPRAAAAPAAAALAAAPAASAAAAGGREAFDFDPDRPENYDDVDNPAAVESFFNSPFFDRRMLWDDLRARGEAAESARGAGSGGGARGRAAGLLHDMGGSEGAAGAGCVGDHGDLFDADEEEDGLDGAGSEVAVSPSWMVPHGVRSGAGGAAAAGALGSGITFLASQRPGSGQLQHFDSVAMLLMGTPGGAGDDAAPAAAGRAPLRIAVPGPGATGGPAAVRAASAALPAPVAIYKGAAAAAALAAGASHGNDDAVVPATPDDDDHRRESLFARGSEGANYGAIAAAPAAAAAAALQPVPTAPAEFVLPDTPPPPAAAQPQGQGQGQGQGQQREATAPAGELHTGERGRPIELLSSDDEAGEGGSPACAGTAAAAAAPVTSPARAAAAPARAAAAAARQAIGRVVAGLRRPRRS